MPREAVNGVVRRHMKHSDALVSIIIPTYNYAQFLPGTLESVLSQKRVNLEVIVVDDGSTDETQHILEDFQAKSHGRLHVLHQNKQGLSAARNAGINLAHGEFLVFLDADDILLQDALASQCDMLFAYSDLHMTVCRSFFFENTDSHGIPIRTGQWRLFCRDLDIHLCHFNIAPPHAFMIRRSLIDLAGGFDTGLTACEDHDFWFRAISLHAKLVANPKAAVAYRRHQTSMSSNTDNQRRHDAILHERIGRHLEGNIHFPLKGRLEGLAAHIAGCLATTERTKEILPEVSEKLRTIAGSTADMLLRESPSSMRCPETLLYLLRRAFMFLWAPIKRNEQWAAELRDCLRQVFHDRCPGPELHLDDRRLLVEESARRLTVSGAHLPAV